MKDISATIKIPVADTNTGEVVQNVPEARNLTVDEIPEARSRSEVEEKVSITNDATNSTIRDALYTSLYQGTSSLQQSRFTQDEGIGIDKAEGS